MGGGGYRIDDQLPGTECGVACGWVCMDGECGAGRVLCSCVCLVAGAIGPAGARSEMHQIGRPAFGLFARPRRGPPAGAVAGGLWGHIHFCGCYLLYFMVPTLISNGIVSPAVRVRKP